MVAMRLWHFYPTIILARSGRGGALLRLGLLRSWVAPHKQWLRLRPSTCVPVDGAQELRGLGRHRGGLSDAFFIITASLPLSLNLSLALSLSLSLSLFLSALLFLSLSLSLSLALTMAFPLRCNVTLLEADCNDLSSMQARNRNRVDLENGGRPLNFHATRLKRLRRGRL